MPITLKDGRYLEDTKQTDGRGYRIYVDTEGSLYTLQGSNIVLSRKASSYDGGEASAVLKSFVASGNNDLIAPYRALKQQFQATLPDPSIFELPEFSSFEKQAGEEVGKFYVKDFAQLDKQFATWRKQAEQKKSLEVKQEAQTYDQYRTYEDRQFARALEAAQNGFAGRGTSTSGIRYKALAEQDADREAKLAEAKLGYDQRGETRELGFSHLLDNYSLQEESQRLALERRQEEDRLARARQLQQEEIMRRQSLATSSNENMANLFNSGISA